VQCNSQQQGAVNVTLVTCSRQALPSCPALCLCRLCSSSSFYCDGGKYADSEFHITDSFSDFSNYITVGNTAAAAHSVAAPGSCINSTYLNNGYAIESGCSFAAPHVSGLVALCFGKWAGVEGRTRAKDGPCMEAFATGGRRQW